MKKKLNYILAIVFLIGLSTNTSANSFKADHYDFLKANYHNFQVNSLKRISGPTAGEYQVNWSYFPFTTDLTQEVQYEVPVNAEIYVHANDQGAYTSWGMEYMSPSTSSGWFWSAGPYCKFTLYTVGAAIQLKVVDSSSGTAITYYVRFVAI